MLWFYESFFPIANRWISPRKSAIWDGEMSRALELPLAHLRKHLQRREVLNALVLRIFLSRCKRKDIEDSPRRFHVFPPPVKFFCLRPQANDWRRAWVRDEYDYTCGPTPEA